VTQPFWVTTPAGPPVASVILFTGGPGLLGSQRQSWLNGKNFLIRSRAKFAAAGFLVASVDGPSDHLEGLDDDFRTSAEHAGDIAAVIAYLRQKAAVPVWLIGTSRGTTSAASIAARLKSGGPDGLVLTSSIVAPTRQLAPIQSTVDVASITVPTLFVHNQDDACMACPFSAVPALMARFTHAPRKELIAVSGGSTPLSDPCEALSRHGYIGIEDEVVGKIAAWIKGV
jgi:pimeloyl-ACP methyl ester carboxylesterase